MVALYALITIAQYCCAVRENLHIIMTIDNYLLSPYCLPLLFSIQLAVLNLGLILHLLEI